MSVYQSINHTFSQTSDVNLLTFLTKYFLHFLQSISKPEKTNKQTIGLERYWHWGIGYCPIFTRIGQYWVLGNTFIGRHTQYQYCLDTLIPVVSRRLQGNWGGGKVKLVVANQGTQNEIQQTVILAFITYTVILIAIVCVSQCCIHVHLLKSIQCFTLKLY